MNNTELTLDQLSAMSGSGPSYGSLLEGPLPGVSKKGPNFGNLLESSLPGVGKNVIVVN